MSKIKVAVIGLGNILPMHITSIMHQNDLQLVGVCDIKTDRVDTVSNKYNVAGYSDYKKMIDETKPDAVHILTPHYLHAPMTAYALNKGVHVLCEKPMSIKHEDAVENVKLAKEKNLFYGVIFQSRYNSASVLVKKHIENGNLGKVISARCILTWSKPDSYYMLSDWKGTWDKEGGGVIIDQAIHSLDLANWFINDQPSTVYAHLSNRNHKIMEVDDSGEGFVKYKGGATLGFYAMNNYGCDEPIEIRLLCEKGKAVLTYDDAKIEFNNGETLTVSKYVEEDIVYEGGKDYWGFQHIKQIRQFYDSIQGKAKLDISGEEALKIQQIVCAIYESSKKGKEIEI